MTDDQSDPIHDPTQQYSDDALRRVRNLLDATGKQIGPYRIIERIGGGGMGEVYRAEQRSPIRREVAIKFIKLGMDTRSVIARFEAERQALALMDHPHIAKVLDAGADENGRPYFVMEYVKGKSITEVADKHQLTIDERVALMEQVCQAIQHAHHKGVIHRDLKPSNILVSIQDGVPFAKVIDFGIAKAVGQQLTDKTLFTQHNEFIGTPQYMSPEQAEGSIDIDTRTDVYSLGVLLYELLTGSPPFTVKEQKQAAWEGLRKQIIEIDPPKPSSRLSSSGVTVTTLANHRRTEPKRLHSIIRGELDWIVMKAIEKDRTLRYDTPIGLSRDLRAFLNHEPVYAAPPSATYRLRKALRKHSRTVFTAGLLFSLVLLGLVVVSWAWMEAVQSAAREKMANDRLRATQDQLRVALDEALNAKKSAEQSAERESTERMRAEEAAVKASELAARERQSKDVALKRQAELTSVLKFVQDNVFFAVRPQGQGSGLGVGITLREALDYALPAINRSFPDQPLIEARVRLALGKAYSSLGDFATAMPQISKARELLQQHLGASDNETLDADWELGKVLGKVGKVEEQLSLYQTIRNRIPEAGKSENDRYLEISLQMADALTNLRRFPQAEQHALEVLSRREQLHGSGHLLLAAPLMQLATIYSQQNLFEKSLPFADRALKIAMTGNDQALKSNAQMTMAQVYTGLGDRTTAIELLERVVKYRREILGLTHIDTLDAMQKLSVLYRGAGRFTEQSNLDSAIQSAVKSLNTEVGKNRVQELAYADVLVKTGRREEAIQMLATAVKNKSEQNDFVQAVALQYRLLIELEAASQSMALAKETQNLVELLRKRGNANEEILTNTARVAFLLGYNGAVDESIKVYKDFFHSLAESKATPNEWSLGVRVNFANVLRRARQWEAALEQDKATYKLVCEYLPETHRYRSETLWGMALSIDQQEDTQDLMETIDRCFEHASKYAANPFLLPNILQLRMTNALKRDDVSQCMKTLDMWGSLRRKRNVVVVTGIALYYRLSQHWRGREDEESQSIAAAYEAMAIDRVFKAVETKELSLADLTANEFLNGMLKHPDLRKRFNLVTVESPRPIEKNDLELSKLLHEGRFKEALDLASSSIKGTENELFLLKIGALQGWFERNEELHRTCEVALSLAETRSIPRFFERVAKLCALNASVDALQTARAEAIIRKAISMDGQSSDVRYFKMVHGMLKFRAGDFATAKTLLDEASSGLSPGYHISLTCNFYKSMSLFSEGEAAKGLELFRLTEKVVGPIPKSDANPFANGRTHDDVIAWLAFREAKRMLQVP